MTNPWENPRPIELEKYLFPADGDLIRCVDERQALDQTNGVEIPGGIYGIIDAIKTLKGVSEEAAWELALKSGIPIGAHVDEHHGERGCGYAKLVEVSPAAVSAPEAVSAADRLARVEAAGGTVMHYLGQHRPTHASLNYREGFSLDPDRALQDNLGIFNCDIWAAGAFAQKLGIDRQQMMQHIEQVFRQTVAALSPIRDFQTFK